QTPSDEEVIEEDSAVEEISEEEQPEPEIIDFSSNTESSEETVSEESEEQTIAEELEEAVEEAAEEAAAQEETPAEEASEEAEYWEQFVGNEEYGHYDENEEWVWDGYFDEDNNFFKEMRKNQ
ncbi:EAGR box-containing protein, partial [Mycoplasma bradburyae]|uniref:EAGR box-containing protein n=1 Tax=Mycoplasma bradburyae TaxID=2963128 RepID=UPI0023416C00